MQILIKSLILTAGFFNLGPFFTFAKASCLKDAPQLALEDSAVGIDRQAAEALAWNLVRSSYEDVEAPLSIVCSLDGDCSEEADLARAKVKLEGFLKGEKLLCLNDAESDLSPENGESLDSNWVFSLSLRKLSDHIYFAVVPKNGQSPAYIYGFN